MLLLASIGVLAFYMLSQRQQQVYLQQHSALVVRQIQAYFDDKVKSDYSDNANSILSDEQLSNELILFQQYSSIHLTRVNNQLTKLNVLPNQQLDLTFLILNGAYQLNWQFSFNQHVWLKQMAMLIRERTRMKSIDKIEGWSIISGYLRGLKIKTEPFITSDYSDHQVKLLVSNMSILEQNKNENIVSVIVLLDNKTLLRVSSPIFKVGQSFEVLLYTLAMVMFVGLFICIIFIRPIERKVANLLKSLDKQVKNPDTKNHRLTLERTIALPKDEIDQISIKVSQMMQRMHQLANDQQEMTRAVSHEFRTPIVKMGYHVELLQDFVAHD
ncbi:MAG: hypothetical protein HRU38_16625, partial [Saccharospirillaceae bacterium]|nr:hypothetical protein [Saccharospirillaceae bacterium]